MTYQLFTTPEGKNGAVTIDSQGRMVSFIFDPDNTDYQEYLKWVAEGNEPEPADQTE